MLQALALYEGERKELLSKANLSAIEEFRAKDRVHCVASVANHVVASHWTTLHMFHITTSESYRFFYHLCTAGVPQARGGAGGGVGGAGCRSQAVGRPA